MSLDIGLTKIMQVDVVSENITHNLTGMWKAVDIYDALYMSEGKTASDVLPVLIKGYRELASNPNKYRQYNHPSGWGTYENAVTWLKNLIEEFEEYPDGIITVSK